MSKISSQVNAEITQRHINCCLSDIGHATQVVHSEVLGCHQTPIIRLAATEGEHESGHLAQRTQVNPLPGVEHIAIGLGSTVVAQVEVHTLARAIGSGTGDSQGEV